MEFNEQFIKKFAKEIDVKVNQVVRRTSFEVFNDMTDNTAVGNPDTWKGSAPKGYVGGRLRASLNISADTPDFSVAPKNANDTPRPQLGVLGHDPTVYITNNLPYAHKVLMEGWSAQTPLNMAEDALQRAYKNLKKVSEI